jgi:sugar-specific transcriptional regulator TrmB
MLLETSEDVQALTALGLTNLQARVYLSLTKAGMATAKITAKDADIPRQEVYRVISELERLGLIQKIISNPTRYKSVRIEDAVDILLGRKQKENIDSADRAKKLCLRYKSYESLTSKEEDIHYILIPPREAFIRKSKELYERTKRCIEVYTSIERARVALGLFENDYKKVLSRGVDVRYLIGKTKEQKEEIAKEKWMENQLFHLRFIQVTPELLSPLIIFDRSELLLVTTEKEKVFQSQCLWTNNPLLVELLLNYFDVLWKHNPLEIDTTTRIESIG